MRPQTGLGTIDKYPTIEQKAAALLHSLIKNHAFHNGNKRTALVAASPASFQPANAVTRIGSRSSGREVKLTSGTVTRLRYVFSV